MLLAPIESDNLSTSQTQDLPRVKLTKVTQSKW